MKNLYIQKISANHYTFDHGNDSASGHFELSMNKTAMGWTIEVTDLTKWEAETTFLWVAETARGRQGLPAQPALHREAQGEGVSPHPLKGG